MRSEEDRFNQAIGLWVDYKERLSREGFHLNTQGLRSWHTLGMGLTCRVVKGTCSVHLLTSQGQAFDGWVIVRSLWESALDIAYFAIQPTHRKRDELATRFIDFDSVQRLAAIRAMNLEDDPRMPEEWLTNEQTLKEKYPERGNSWRGFSTSELINKIQATQRVAMSDRIPEVVDIARTTARWAEMHWRISSKYTHSEPMAIITLWDGASLEEKWTDARDHCEPAHCLREATHALMTVVSLYASTSGAPTLPPDDFPFDSKP